MDKPFSFQDTQHFSLTQIHLSGGRLAGVHPSPHPVSMHALCLFLCFWQAMANALMGMAILNKSSSSLRSKLYCLGFCDFFLPAYLQTFPWHIYHRLCTSLLHLLLSQTLLTTLTALIKC
jgi:hypothetical protein